MNTETNWWEDFFSGLALDFVRESRDTEDTLREADFIEMALQLMPGARVLDVPCGAGRLSRELSGRGYSMTGVDFSPSLLPAPEGPNRSETGEIQWECRDMRDLPWTAQFDGAFCWWSSFGYFDETDDLQFLQAVGNTLKSGARFVLDTPLMETRLPEMVEQEREWWRAGDLWALEDRDFDHATSRIESDWTFLRGPEVETKHLSQRLYTYRELTRLLEQAGFGSHQAFGSMDWEPFALGAPWLYLVTTRL